MEHAIFCPDYRLARAIQYGDIDRVCALVPAHQSADLPTPDAISPLALACREGNAPIVQLLLELGADPNFPAWPHEWKITPLILAIEAGANDCVRALLEGGADANTMADDFQCTCHGEARCTPWLLAEVTCNAPALELLRKHGADPRLAERLGISDRTFRPPTSVRAQYLVSGQPVCELIQAGETLDIIDNALRRVADLDENGGRLLRTACRTLRLDVINLLLQYGANPNAISVPLAMLDDGSGAIAERLLCAGCDANFHPSGSPLVAAATAGRAEVIHRLVQHGAEPDRVCASETWVSEPTPLVAALLSEQVECVEALLARGAHPDLASRGLPHREELRHGEPNPLKMWFERVRWENAVAGSLACPPLAIACGVGLTPAVQALLRYGANSNFRAADGSCAGDWLDMVADQATRAEISRLLSAPRRNVFPPPSLL